MAYARIMDRPEPDARAWDAPRDKADEVASAGGKIASDMPDLNLHGLIASLPPCPGLPSTPEEIAVADAKAEADIAAGRVYPHSIVSAWLETWGKPNRKPFREWLKSAG